MAAARLGKIRKKETQKIKQIKIKKKKKSGLSNMQDYILPSTARDLETRINGKTYLALGWRH